MDAFTRGLYIDLDRRCTVMQQRIAAAMQDPDLAMHAKEVDQLLSGIKTKIGTVLRDPDAMKPQNNHAHSVLFQRLAEREQIAELYLVPALERYSEHDRRLTRTVKLLCDQINWPIQAPLVFAASDAGYMTFMQLFLMKLPALEDESILAYPDLVHELGHILMLAERKTLIGDFVNHLSDYFVEQQHAKRPLSPQYYERWLENWMEEYVCDMIAVYVCGPAFGAQHRRLTSTYPPRAFEHAPSHPADEARLRGAAAVLRKMGHDADADDIMKLWGDHMSATKERKGRDYDRIAPDALIDLLAARVVEGCEKLGLRRFDALSVQQHDDVVGMMQEAWKQFRTDPDNFPQWEEARLQKLWQDLGLGGNGNPAVIKPRGPVTPPQRELAA